MFLTRQFQNLDRLAMKDNKYIVYSLSRTSRPWHSFRPHVIVLLSRCHHMSGRGSWSGLSNLVHFVPGAHCSVCAPLVHGVDGYSHV